MKKVVLFIIAALLCVLMAVLLLHRFGSSPADEPPYYLNYSPEQLEQELVRSFSASGGSISPQMTEMLDLLTKSDPDNASRWRELLEYWDHVANSITVNINTVPDDLPNDSSLCIVVLGFQLLQDGSMSPELVSRCEAALNCAEQYPNSFIAVTGGGTARNNPEVTEAGSMAQWLIENGISADRIIIEDSSMTTAQNAVFTDRLFTAQHPDIRYLMIVTSEYHIRRGCMVFAAETLLTDSPVRVIANSACYTGNSDRDSVRLQGSDILQVAGYYYDFSSSQSYGSGLR